jgi:hypothetical protein
MKNSLIINLLIAMLLVFTVKSQVIEATYHCKYVAKNEESGKFVFKPKYAVIYLSDPNAKWYQIQPTPIYIDYTKVTKIEATFHQSYAEFTFHHIQRYVYLVNTVKLIYVNLLDEYNTLTKNVAEIDKLKKTRKGQDEISIAFNGGMFNYKIGAEQIVIGKHHINHKNIKHYSVDSQAKTMSIIKGIKSNDTFHADFNKGDSEGLFDLVTTFMSSNWSKYLLKPKETEKSTLVKKPDGSVVQHEVPKVNLDSLPQNLVSEEKSGSIRK